MTLINPADLAQIKSKRPAPSHDLQPRWAAQVSANQWRKAYGAASELLTNHIEEVRHNTDGTEIAAYLLSHALDLIAHGIVQFAGPHADPRAEVRRATDDALAYIWNGIDRAIKEVAGETEIKLREMARGEYNALLKEDRAAITVEREMLASTTDTALAEASAAQRQVTALEQQLKLSRQQVTKLEYDIKKVKEGALKPSAETLILRERVTLLEQQAKVSQPSRNVSQPEVTKMPTTILSCDFDTLTEAMSFCAHARDKTFQPQIMTGSRVVRAGGADLTAALNRWRHQIADPREHLRGLPSVQAVISTAGREAAD